MRAQLIRSHGGPEVFEAAELPMPEPGPGQVRVRQIATSVNPVDTKIRRHGPALGPALPAVLGCDIAGFVDAIGPGVSDFAIGDRVYGCGGGVRGMGGAYAEAIVTDAALLAPAPRSLPLRAAAALPLVAITAWEGLDRAAVQAGSRVLVLGGSGGVGHLAVQLAAVRGAQVTATASSAEKAALLRTLGAHAVLDHRAADFATQLAAAAGVGFDVVYDATGGHDPQPAFAATRPNGQVVLIVSTFSTDLTPMHLKGLSLHVVFMLLPMLTGHARAVHGGILRELAALIDEGRVAPVLAEGRRYGLEDVAAAHAQLEAGGFAGKLVIDIADETAARAHV